MNKSYCDWLGKWWLTMSSQGIENICSICDDRKGCKKRGKAGIEGFSHN